MKAGDFLNKLATKSGIASTDKNLIELLSKSEFANMEINDELAGSIDKSLMTLEAAKSHPEVVKKIKGETLNGADAIIEKTLATMGYSDEEIADIKSDKNTFNKIEKTALLIKALEGKKSAAASPDKAAYQKQIDELNAKLRETAEASDQKIQDLTSKYTAQVTDMKVKNLIAAKKLALPDTMDPELKSEIALNAVKAELTKQGFQIVNTNGNLEVKRADGTDAFDASHRKVDLTGLIDGALSQNSLLVVSDPSKKGIAQPVLIPGQGPPVINHQAISIIDQSMEDAGVKG